MRPSDLSSLTPKYYSFLKREDSLLGLNCINYVNENPKSNNFSSWIEKIPPTVKKLDVYVYHRKEVGYYESNDYDGDRKTIFMQFIDQSG